MLFLDDESFLARLLSQNSTMDFHSREDPAIMQSMDQVIYIEGMESGTSFGDRTDSYDVARALDFESLNIHSHKSFLLIDQEENLKIDTAGEFIDRLGCNSDSKLKVISIFGNSGDGKSYYLNNLLFKGEEVFKTSKCAEEGTRGIWAAWHGAKQLLCLDTPPLHCSSNSDILLMKILAISDIVIYRTRSERLPEDLFTFLGQAAKAFCENFKCVLRTSGHPIENGGPASTQGPAVFICHEPLHSDPLGTGPNGESPEDQIKAKFGALGHNVDVLGNIYYVPTQPPVYGSQKTTAMLLKKLLGQLSSYLSNTALRAARSPESVLITLKALLSRFRGRLTCDSVCEVCEAVCTLSMGHGEEKTKHSSEEKCRYHYQYENKILICRKCNNKVKTVEQSQETWIGYAKSALSGYELICPMCGTIYKSRQYWFGNQSPEDTVVYPKFVHVWSGQDCSVSTKGNVGVRKALEGVGNLMNTAYIYSTDCIAPAYWQPNSEISKCYVCSVKLEVGWGEVHHCRACGMGVCNKCSETRMPVPNRGWADPVRVCDRCKNTMHQGDTDESANVTPRKVSEVVVNALKPLGVALNYPKGVITKLARPSYWIPDEEAPVCAVCDILFGLEPHDARHHCRRCGQSVCRNCSPHRQSVPERGWNEPVRVCKKCISEEDAS